MWAGKIGNHNDTSTHAGAPMKAFAIVSEAKAMISQGVATAQNLPDAGRDPYRIGEIKWEWLKVPGQKPGVTWHYVQMLAGVPCSLPLGVLVHQAAGGRDCLSGIQLAR